ncbi:MAG: precorrin-3B C(17)-methyltransferase [Alphaproteobacteria bacterium]|nr:precorrin-3B C(17)-methyltransferase [Alphaproteobacteria bacterium]
MAQSVNKPPSGAAIVVLGPGALGLARRLKRRLHGATVHGLAKRVEARQVDHSFADTMAHLRRLFRAGTPILGLCASGILIRALAPLLADKTAEPPVVALSEDGAVAVPLLGGHHGANALARAVAAVTRGQAAITTAGDRRLGLALDEPPPGWCVANAGAAKPITAALLAGDAVALTIDGALDASLGGWLTAGGARFAKRAGRTIRITHRQGAARRTLALHPPVLALGVGCERDTAPAELEALVMRTLAANGLAAEAVAAVCSIDLKADEPAVHALAAKLGVPARFFPAAMLERERPRLANPSELVFRETGCHGVAEGAALAAVGGKGRLVVPKRKSRRATCAAALSPAALDAGRIGRAQGRLTVVGIGPGSASTRTPAVSAALDAATHVVGYGLYLDLLGEPVAGKTLHRGTLGAEAERVRLALDLAATGESVALVSSGDAGIYALATLVFETIAGAGRADWNRVAIEVLPGVSALQTAAARAGAPLGHDFCAISLSDLLTPWTAIERRLKAAAQGDFVIALFNPASGRRRSQLVRVRKILLKARPVDTPVIVARNLDRPGERVETTTLGEFDPATVDMLTLVMIGSSATRLAGTGGRHWVFTPRGYARKPRA